MAGGHPVPAKTTEREIEVRKSRFIARAARAATRDEAMTIVERARRDHPDARHHCWAYLLGNPDSATSAATSDAGEPSGTAGKPILNVIQHKGIGDIVVVVIRYFGGIKLGAGGLVRAYSGATEAVLSSLPVTAHRPLTTARLALHFAQEQAVRHWAEQHGARVGALDYGDGVALDLHLPRAALDSLSDFCGAAGIRWREVSNGD